jgi:putative membrane protein
MSNLYLWLKAAHVFGVVCWFAGLFYLPRLFVYHSTTDDAPGKARFRTMEEKLYRIIMRPAMLIAVGFGLWLTFLSWQAFAGQLWLWLKLAFVVVLLGYHHYCGRLIRAFATETNPHSERFYRIFNEVPALLLLVIVVLVIVKPF